MHNYRANRANGDNEGIKAMADLFKMLKEKQMLQPMHGEAKPAVLPLGSETNPSTEQEGEGAASSPRAKKHDQAIALSDFSKKTPWGIPIPDGWDATDPVFQRPPKQCDCFRAGVLRCGVPCVWAWPPGSKVGDKVLT